MHKPVKILFVVMFLACIGMVPVVQTLYEVRSNTGNRVQMLDLVEDIFITPYHKAVADAGQIDSLLLSLKKLDNSGDALGVCDESIITVKLLKQNVINYNRHIAGVKSPFAALDTVKPYYRSLDTLQKGLEHLLDLLQGGAEAAATGPAFTRCKQNAAVLKSTGPGSPGAGLYARVTLEAMSRMLVGADYLRPFEKEMEKSSIFANAVRPWLLLGYFRAFNDLGSKGILGRSNWFFYRSDVEYLVKPYVFDPQSKIVDPLDGAFDEDIVGAVVSFKNQLAERGIDLLFVPMPTKPSIYPDLLHPGMQPALTGSVSHSLRMMDELRKAGVESVDLFAAFADERKNDEANGDAIYLRTDTHFKGRGVLAAARAVADRVKQYPWYQPGSTEYAIDTVTIDRVGDIGEMVDFPPRIMKLRRPPFQAEPTKCFRVWKIERDDSGGVAGKTIYKDDFRSAQVLVLGDSYSRIFQTDQPRSAGWIAHLANELSQPVASIVNDGGASTLVRETLARKPNVLKGKKLVIWEVVERDFRYGEEGWKDIRIAD